MLHEFRIRGAHLVPQAQTDVELYFLARHHGLASRLLDWTSNPLAALFFAVEDGSSEPGHVLIMNAFLVPQENQPTAPDNRSAPEKKKLPIPNSVHSVRHSFVEAAIKRMFWTEPQEHLPKTVLAIRPDSQMGRVANQSSCFTFHMEGHPVVANPSMRRIVVTNKVRIKEELNWLNFNTFTVYQDLDHLGSYIHKTWGGK